MSEQRDVKVFISWSGDLAKSVAVALREWLPLLFDRVEPWASDTDIAAGQRGLAQVEAELSDTRFGVVVVTSENQHAPWINFEAGALSRTIPGDVEQRVVPLLVDLSGPTQLTGPLVQFQAKVANREGVMSLLRSLATVAGIEDRVVDQRFAAYWPQLEEKIEDAKAAAAKGKPTQPRRDQRDVLDEILLHVRALRSEPETDSSATVRKGPGAFKTFQEFAEHVADDFPLRVVAARQVPGDPPYEVSVVPDSTAAESRVDAFQRRLSKRLGGDVLVEVVPF